MIFFYALISLIKGFDVTQSGHSGNKNKHTNNKNESPVLHQNHFVLDFCTISSIELISWQKKKKREIFQGEFPISVSCNFEVLEVQMNYFWMKCYSIKGLIKAHWSQHYFFYWFQWAMNLSLLSQEYSRAETFLRREEPARKATKMYHTYQEIQGHCNKGSRIQLLCNC